jgi:hypothetical protein
MAASDIGSGTADGLVAFCDYLIDKNLAPASAINPWKSAAKQVFSRVEHSDDLRSIDVQNLDVEEYLSRFYIASRGDYKPESLNAYASRFRKAIEAYRGYLADPAGWKPRLRHSPRRTLGNKLAAATSDPAAPNPPASGINLEAFRPPQTPAQHPAMTSLIDYPFPLKSGQLAHLHLPSPLDKDDADRLTQFLRSLVFERQAQLSSGALDEGQVNPE